MQKLHNEPGPIEALLLLALATLWAVWTLARLVLAPTAALLLTLARWRPAAPAAAPVTAGTAPALTALAPAPLTSPLAELAQQASATLEPLTVAQLRARARSSGLPRALTRNGRRADLLQALGGLEAAMA